MQYTDMQLDALRELANIGSGNAGTALSGMLGRTVDISVPNALVLPLADAVESAGPPESSVTGVVLTVSGSMDAIVLLLFPPADADRLCGMLGLEPGSEVAASALNEIGNILGTSYINALAAMSGLVLEPSPPQQITDMLAAIVSTVLAAGAGHSDFALILDSELKVEGDNCSLSFLLVPSPGGVEQLLSGLGLA